jgi:hypothetical protein
MADTHEFAGLRLRQRPPGSARVLLPQLSPFLAEYRAKGEAAVAEPFTGITTDGTLVRGFFSLAETGVPTGSIRDAAEAFLTALTPAQQATALFPLESEVWRRWSNIHPFIMRHGVCLDELMPGPRQRALALVETSLSARTSGTPRRAR